MKMHFPKWLFIAAGCLFLLLLSGPVYSQYVDSSGQFVPRIVKVNNYKSVLATHGTIAVLPFMGTIRWREKELKTLPEDQIRKEPILQGKLFYTEFYTKLIKKRSEKICPFMIQDSSETFRLLAEAGITPETIRNYPPAELAQLLNVDAVISCQFQSSNFFSKGVAIGVAAATLAASVVTGVVLIPNTHGLSFSLSITDRASETNIWQLNKQISSNYNAKSLFQIHAPSAVNSLPYWKLAVQAPQ